MKTKRMILAISLAAGFLSVNALQAADRYWDGGAADNSWGNPTNWNGDTLPVTGTGTTGDALYINDATATYPIYNLPSVTSVYRTVRIGYGSPPTGVPAANGRLDIIDGTLTADSSDQVRIGRGAGRTGTLNQFGGTFNAGGIVQLGVDNGATGIVNLSGGTFNANRNAAIDSIAAVSLELANGNGTTTGTFNLTGGLLSTRTGVLVGTSTGGVGVFSVGGAGTATIGAINLTDSGFWYQRASGTLRVTVDSAGFTLGGISIFDTNHTSYLTFDANSTLDLGFSGAAPGSTMSWDLITYTNGIAVTDNGLTLGAGDAAAGWSYAFVSTATPGMDALRITYTVPEPAVTALAGLGLLVFFWRARPRA